MITTMKKKKKSYQLFIQKPACKHKEISAAHLTDSKNLHASKVISATLVKAAEACM